MVVDRIERHDVLNAIMLAAVLLLLGFGLITAVESLFDTVDEGLVVSTKDPALESEELAAGATTTSSTVVEETTTIVEARPASEVAVRVANGARRSGVAGAGTNALQAAGYDTLSPKNGPTTDDSIVYYVSGYAAEAARVAEVLGLDLDQVSPMPSDPGVAIDNANIIVILGVNSNF